MKMIGKPLIKTNIIGKRTAPYTPVSQKTNQGKQKDNDILRGIHYVADNSGCGHYRMIWPQLVMNSRYNGYISDCRKVVLNERFYKDIKVVRMQRQVSSQQRKLFENIREICNKTGSRLIYELDDIPFYEDIPLYNQNRSSYARKEYRENIEAMMNMSDEVTVTCKFMRDYFKSKIQNQKITVIPNYMPKFWIDRYYDEHKLKINYSKHKKRPRILYAGSGSHYGKGGVEDDFTKLEDFVRKTVKEYEWVFFGGIPRKLMDLYDNGKIEFHKYRPVVDYCELYHSLNANISIAPLLKNNFNRAKSNIKLIENGAVGIPCICQDGIDTYDQALYKFDTPSELHDQIKMLTQDGNAYMKACRKSRMLSDKYWLEDNIGTWKELYDFSYSDDKRVELNKLQ